MDVTHLDRAVEEQPAREQPSRSEQHLDVPEVGLDGVRDVRELDLHRDLRGRASRRSVRREHGSVHLPDRRRSEGQAVERLEVVLPGGS